MEIFRKGGGSDPIHNFATHFLCSKVMEFLPKIRGGGVDINSIKMLHFLRFLNNIFFDRQLPY